MIHAAYETAVPDTRQTADAAAMLIELLVHGAPAAHARGARIAADARRLAERFSVPERFLPDLDAAARLHALGVLVEPHAGGDIVRLALATDRLLRALPALHGAADLVLAMGEHWDGSGGPARRQRGQIPLRSRFLRALHDLHVARDVSDDLEAVLPLLRAHAGTRYDPVVVQQVEAVAHDAAAPGAPERVHVAVRDLHEGMVLAEDLCTASGMLLLARGATLTHGSLEIIRRREAGDPILAGPFVVAEGAV